MRKIFVTLGLLAAVVFGAFGAGPAGASAPVASVQQATAARPAITYVNKTEHLQCSVGDRLFVADVYYSLGKDTAYSPDHWYIKSTSGSAYPGPIGNWDTISHTNANRLDIDYEYAPGQWTEMLHLGGDKDTWNDVAVSGSFQISHYLTITDATSTPQWRLQVWGGAGDSTGSCNNSGNVD